MIIAVHLGASGALQDPAWLRVTERPVSANVSQVIAAEFVVDCDVDNQVAVTAEVDVLEHQVTPPHLVVALLDGRDAARISGLEQRDAAMSRVSPQFFYMS